VRQRHFQVFAFSRLFSSVCSHPKHDVIEFVYSSFSIFSQTLDDPSSFFFYLERRREKNIDSMSAARKLLLSYGETRRKNWKKKRRGSVQNDHHFRLIKTVIVALHQTSLSFKCEIQQLKIVGALTNMILNLLVPLLRFVLISTTCRNSHVAYSPPFFVFYAMQTKHMKGFHRI
jgi:hypothetical protein